MSELEKCFSFLAGIGITVKQKEIKGDFFLPGLAIENGCIIVDADSLKYPGDVLHEAGHIAVIPAAERSVLNTAGIEKRKEREAEEMMAIAWSYAACIHLDIDPHFVFHDDGYQMGGSYIIANFNNKNYFGLPMLQWCGMAVDDKLAVEQGVQPYPHMIKWLRE